MNMVSTRMAYAVLSVLLLASSLPAAADVAPVQRDAAGNRLETLLLQGGQGPDGPERYCTADGQWCVQALPSAGEDQPASLEVAERADAEGEPQMRYVPIDVVDDGDLRVWPFIVRLAPGAGAGQAVADPQQAALQNVLVGGLVEARAMYSGGGASASTLHLARIRHLDDGIQVDADVLSVAWSANKMIRACFSERDFDQRAGACHDEYSFDAELALATEAQDMPVLRYQTGATNYPAGVSPQRDSLAKGRLTKKDLRTEQDAQCSYTRTFRFTSGAYQPDQPLPECSAYTEP
ncbi:hypothetical protein [Stenotrophomonas indicatrix]|uniref:hypothetical protein n=2 Tax=Stenotrophomonas indicatrix TaxID=2045451 RepID=UPI00215A7A5B|nr:hypothetical protein [Stenotrophomonas indicatrix]MCR8715092.1 hypothetical protein [Stenotrophomonas indicatrix]